MLGNGSWTMIRKETKKCSTRETYSATWCWESPAVGSKRFEDIAGLCAYCPASSSREHGQTTFDYTDFLPATQNSMHMSALEDMGNERLCCVRAPGNPIDVEHRGKKATFRIICIDVLSGLVGICCTDDRCIWGELPLLERLSSAQRLARLEWNWQKRCSRHCLNPIDTVNQ